LARLKLPMPRTTRELFELFALYHPTEGLNGLLPAAGFLGRQATPDLSGGARPRAGPIELVLPAGGYRPRST
jgi:hypothetical protein